MTLYLSIDFSLFQTTPFGSASADQDGVVEKNYIHWLGASASSHRKTQGVFRIATARSKTENDLRFSMATQGGLGECSSTKRTHESVSDIGLYALVFRRKNERINRYVHIFGIIFFDFCRLWLYNEIV